MPLQEYLDIQYSMDIGVPEEELCRWDIVSKKLIGSQRVKALKFNRLNLIESLGKGIFKVKPIEGYNSTTYTVEYKNGWRCNCQWHCKNLLDCSHILAVLLWIGKNRKNG